MNDESKPVAIFVTEGSLLGVRMGRIVQTMSALGIACKIVNVNEMVPTGGFQVLGFDELAPQVQQLEFPGVPSPKRRALLAQLERAKLRRDKNQIRDLTRQLEHTP